MSEQEDLARLEAFGGVGLVAVTDRARLPVAVAAVERTVEAFDLACSRFRDDSEVSALGTAGGAAVRVGPVLLDAVEAALRAARVTGGDVDPTVGRALIALGYDRDFEAVVGDPPPVSRVLGSVPGWRTVVVDRPRSTIRVAPGVVLDLGATAKALAADRAAAEAFAAAGCGVLVSFAGDLAIAGPAPGDGWRVRVTDDHRSGIDAPGQWISLRSGGLATSSTAVRRWRTSGGTAHHLVDPSTGDCVESAWRTASVTAGSCLDANIASTAAIIRSERAPAWLESLELPSRLVSREGAVRHVAGWPPEGDDLAVDAAMAGRMSA